MTKEYKTYVVKVRMTEEEANQCEHAIYEAWEKIHDWGACHPLEKVRMRALKKLNTAFGKRKGK